MLAQYPWPTPGGDTAVRLPATLNRGPRTSRDGEPRLQWITAVERNALVTNSTVFLQDEATLRAVNVETGELRWSTPFLGRPIPPIPGARLRPCVYGALVVATTLRDVHGFDAGRGTIEWQLGLKSLFATEDETEISVISVSAPTATDRGVLITALGVVGNRVETRLVLIDEQGSVIWNRSAGGASGATYVALGSAQPSVAAIGDRAYVLPQRGFLAAYHLSDGALDWAVGYPSYPSAGSRDALRYGESTRTPRLEARGRFVVAAPADASSLIVWDRFEGNRIATVPRQGARWWSWGEGSASAELALVHPDQVSFWKLDNDGTPIPTRERVLSPTEPRYSGPGASIDGRWWFPVENGAVRIDADSALHSQPLVGLTDVRSVVPWGEVLVVIDESGATLFRGKNNSSPQLTVDDARADLARGELTAAIEILDATPGDDQARTEREPLAREAVEWILRQSELPPRADSLATRAVKALPRQDERSRYGFELAQAFARAGRTAIAIELAYGVFDSAAQDTRIDVAPDFSVTVALATRRFLTQLLATEGAMELPVYRAIATRADEELERLLPTRSTTDLRSLWRRFPLTTSGRRAALEVAQRFYEQRNERLSLQTLERIVLLEPDTPEAVEARFRAVEIHRFAKRYASARVLLDELRGRYSDLKFVADPNGTTVGHRAELILASLPPSSEPDANDLDSNRILAPVWRSRTELLHSRAINVVPLKSPGTDVYGPHYLVISQRSIELREAENGQLLWVSRFPRPASDVRRRLYLDLGSFRAPIRVTESTVLLHDGERLMAISLEDGDRLWERFLPEARDEEGEFPNHIERVAANDDVVLAIGSTATLYAFDANTGEPLWESELGGAPIPGEQLDDPAGEREFRRSMQIEGDRFVIAYQDPARVEVRNLNTGDVIRTLDEPENTIFSQCPWFVDGGEALAIPNSGGVLRIVGVNDGVERGRIEFPSPVRAYYRKAELPHPVAELAPRRGKPILASFSIEDRRRLGDHTPKVRPRMVNDVRYFGGDLFVLSGGVTPRLVALEVPPALRESPVSRDLPTPFELRQRWSQSLRKQRATEALHFHRDRVLVRDKFLPQFTVLNRSNGSYDPTGQYRAALEFASGRDRLHFAEFIGDTLVIHTARGGMGFRPFSEAQLDALTWRALASIDLLAESPPERPPAEAAPIAFRSGRVDEACRILERNLTPLDVTPGDRRRWTVALEGLSQEEGEGAPLQWKVPLLARAPVIDGSLDEPWDARSAIEIRAPRYFLPIQGLREDLGAWTGWRDLSAVLYTGWSDKGFHLALDVTDDRIHAYDNSARRWNGDCLLIAFDILDDGGQVPHPDDLLLTLALTVPKPQPGEGEDEGLEEEDEPEEEDEETDRDDSPDGEYTVQRKPDDSGVIYEVTIPWSTFEARRPREQSAFPYSGLTFRMNLVLTDDDTGRGSRSYFSLSPGQKLREETRGIWDVFVPDLFPRLELTE